MSDKMPVVTIYTDGGADPNPGPGGWAAILIHQESGVVKELSGGEPATTNNRMELTAAIKALEGMRQPCEVRFFTDSEYLRRGITEWLPDWIRSGWQRKGGEIQNVDLWQRLSRAAARHTIHWEWVRGHAGNRYNERADALASAAIRSQHAPNVAQPADAEIYVRVSCIGKHGGWAALIRQGQGEQILSGAVNNTTANQLDILATVEALRSVRGARSIRVWSGSDYLRNGVTQWLPGWQRQGWKTKSGSPVKNRREWRQLAALLENRQAEWPPAKNLALPEFSRLDTVARAAAARATQR